MNTMTTIAATEKTKEIKSLEEMINAKLELKAVISQENKSSSPDDTDLSLINQYTRREFKADEIYTYPLILCDNTKDRDFEYFSKATLEQMSPLFIGKTGIQNHWWEASLQHSRIYKTWTEEVAGKVNHKGEPYYRLMAKSYTIKAGNESFIAKIDAGILKEVSIGFRMKTLVCDICGNSYWDYEKCFHRKGRVYNIDGKDMICLCEMKDVTDVFEYSFVAVPAQPEAGATKGYKYVKETKEETQEKQGDKKEIEKDKQKTEKPENPAIFIANIYKRSDLSVKFLQNIVDKAKAENKEDIQISLTDLNEDLKNYSELMTKNTELEAKIKELEPKAVMGEQYITDLKAECIRLGGLAEGERFNADIMKAVFDKCSPGELKAFREQYNKAVDEKFPPQSQISDSDKSKQIQQDTDFEAYKI